MAASAFRSGRCSTEPALSAALEKPPLSTRGAGAPQPPSPGRKPEAQTTPETLPPRCAPGVSIRDLSAACYTRPPSDTA
eukprot:802107-Pyramimonas_sp.AAC.1